MDAVLLGGVQGRGSGQDGRPGGKKCNLVVPAATPSSCVWDESGLRRRAEEKVAVVMSFEKLSEGQQGRFLREKGLHEATLIRWIAFARTC